MDWIKVKVKHAEYEFLGATDSIFRTWIMLMIFVAAIERKPLHKQLHERLGKDNYENLEKWLSNNGMSVDIIIDKVLEDVERVNSHKARDRIYMQEYRGKSSKTLRKTLHKTLRGHDVNGKIREEKIREDIYIGKPNLEAPILYLNEKTQKNFDPKNRSNQEFVRARYAEGRTLDDFKKVIDKKVAQWHTDEKMARFLRPATLFNCTNFESYLNEVEPKPMSLLDKYAVKK